MHEKILAEIARELREALVGSAMGKVYQLSRSSYVIDFRRPGAGFLFLGTEGSSPRIHLVRRTTRELEKSSVPLGEFGQSLRAVFSGAILEDVRKDSSDRVVRLSFTRQQETGELHKLTLVVQLSGRSANLFLLDQDNLITHAQRLLGGVGQQIGDSYQPPDTRAMDSGELPFVQGEFESFSAAADNYYREADALRLFEADAALARNKLRQEISKLEKLRRHLQNDLDNHGDPEQHKHIGDLLLANISEAQRSGNKVRLKDFYAADLPVVEIELDEKTSLQAEAAKYFARYGKAKRAAKQISERLREIDARLPALQSRQNDLEQIIADRDEEELEKWLRPASAEKKAAPTSKEKQKAEKIPGVRRYLSSDGLEVLVGRAAKDNDHLTFRIARSQDLWLHAADYPGSHVIVRNQNRKEAPHRTIIEAAQLAAKFSQAASDAKVNVNYTQQKFVSRIKGAAPGLVRLASFRTITVEPKEGIERI